MAKPTAAPLARKLPKPKQRRGRYRLPLQIALVRPALGPIPPLYSWQSARGARSAVGGQPAPPPSLPPLPPLQRKGATPTQPSPGLICFTSPLHSISDHSAVIGAHAVLPGLPPALPVPWAQHRPGAQQQQQQQQQRPKQRRQQQQRPKQQRKRRGHPAGRHSAAAGAWRQW